MLFHHVRKKFGKLIGYVSLMIFWITFEYLHMRWDLTWPWLTLGNGLSRFPYFIQWYEYTGALGGSLWILIMNILIFEAINPVLYKEGKFSIKSPASITAIVILILPIIISLFIYSNYKETGPKKNVVVVQPNIDPYNEKFDYSTLDLQMNKLLSLSAEDVDSSTDYLVWPETAIGDIVSIDLDNVEFDSSIILIRRFLKKYPKLKLVTGISAYHTFSTKETPTTFNVGNGQWREEYNAAIQLDSSMKIQVYYKSVLVPFVESVPYPKLFAFLEPLLINIGGTSVSYGRQENRSVFFSADKTGIAPVICYESIFGEYISDYVKNGANLIFIMTNDGWWGNTDGHLQHLYYGAMRAIENRRSIARSANTGTSCFVDEKGDITQATPWWQPAVIKASLTLNLKETFYTRHGDYIGFYALLISAILILLAVIKFILERI